MTIRTLAGAGVLLASCLLASGPAFANADPLAFYQSNAATAAKQPERTPSSRARTTGPASAVVASAAARLGVPQNLALAVCQVESRCRFGLVGRAGERGPMQIKLQTARGLGYSGSAAGLNGAEGAYWGVKHLAVAYKKCGTARGAARLHQAGLAAGCGGSGYARRVMAQM